jgi:hypothetical protein
MARPIITELILFLFPFALYALFLWVTKRGGIFDRANWPLVRVFYLLIAAFVLVIVSFIWLAEGGGAPPRSTYIPAHIEDGKLVPGQTQK